MRVALVASWLNQYGGAERVLEVLHGLFPAAPVYTSIHWPEALPASWQAWDIRVSRLDKLPFIHRHHQPYLPLYPLAFEEFDLSGYDLVISLSSAFAHGVITPPETRHLCYCLTPARFLWNYHGYVRGEGLGRPAEIALAPVLAGLRVWDRLAADRVDAFATLSRVVQRRIAKYYGREAVVIYPPVDVKRFTVGHGGGDYYLIISRLVPYKNIDLAIAALNRLGKRLLIIGEGRDRARLEALAQPNVRFLGRLSDEEVREYLSQAKALIFPGSEDFGLTPVEAQAAGRPVIAYASGGALESVIEGVTGAFFREPTVEALVEAVERFRPEDYDPARARANAERFSRERFACEFQAFVQSALEGRR